MTVTQAQVDAVVETVRARHMENVAVVAMADALVLAAKSATDVLVRQRPIPSGAFKYPHNEIASLLAVAQEQLKVTILYDVLALALQRLGEPVER